MFGTQEKDDLCIKVISDSHAVIYCTFNSVGTNNVYMPRVSDKFVKSPRTASK